jgi:transcriptional regulator with XRE-family HTH domain
MRTISQEDLARMAGITQESLSKAERGILRLSIDVQALIATILGVSRAEIFPTDQERIAS